MKRVIAFLLIVSLVLVSCNKGNKKDEYAIKYGDTTISETVFNATLVSYKSDFIAGYLGLDEDQPDLWDEGLPDGSETFGDYVKGLAVEDLCQFVYVVDFAKKNGCEITEDDRKKAEDNIADMKEELGESRFNEYIEKLGFDGEGFLAYTELSLLYDKGLDILTGEGGDYEIKESDINDHYNKNWVTVKHIYINNIYSDESASEEKLIELSDEDKQKKTDEANALYQSIVDGASFDELYARSEDGMSESFPDGISFEKGMLASEVYESKAFELKEGEIGIVEVPDMGMYILKRVPLAPLDDENGGYIESELVANATEKIYNDHKSEFEINAGVCDTANMRDVEFIK